MSNNFVRMFLVMVACCWCTGCAIGNRSQYQGGFALNLERATSDTPIVVGVQDNRPSVLSGTNSETNVGTMRSLAGVPWAVHTTSKHPLAQDIGESIVETMKKSGYNVLQLKLNPRSTDEELLLGAKTLAPDGRIFHFVLKEWSNDMWFSQTFNYCLELSVKNMAGAKLSTVSQCGKETLAETNPSFRNLAVGVATVIDRTINAPETRMTLAKSSGSMSIKASKAPAPKGLVALARKTCTTDQMLEMKRLKLSDEQIRVACAAR